MGGAQPLAATIAGASMLAIECDQERIAKRLETGYLDQSTESLEEALRLIKLSLDIGIAGVQVPVEIYWPFNIGSPINANLFTIQIAELIGFSKTILVFPSETILLLINSLTSWSFKLIIF